MPILVKSDDVRGRRKPDKARHRRLRAEQEWSGVNGLKLIWPRSSFKTTKMLKNAFLAKGSRGERVKTSIFLAYFRDLGKRNLDFVIRDSLFFGS